MEGGSNTISHAIMGLIHLIGWSIVIGLIVYFFKKHKREAQEDERMKKWLEKHKKEAKDG